MLAAAAVMMIKFLGKSLVLGYTAIAKIKIAVKTCWCYCYKKGIKWPCIVFVALPKISNPIRLASLSRWYIVDRREKGVGK